jgi:glycine oxidase
VLAISPAENKPTELDLGNASAGSLPMTASIHSLSPQASPARVKPGAARALAIVGGGVMGLGIGWRLAQAGWRVDLYERGKAGRGASWAAAGMLAAGLEAEPGEAALLALNRQSQALWRGFARTVEAESGIGLGYRDEGTLLLALDRDQLAALRFTHDFQGAAGIALEWLDAPELRRREPFLHPGALAALYCAADHQVDNRKLVEALQRLFLAAGGRLHEESPVERIEIKGGRVAGLRVRGERVPVEQVLLAAGAWSRRIEGLPEALRPPVRPVKGQLIALQMDPAAPLLRHVVWAPKVYLVPRDDGRLILGATVEERGFDERLTAGGMLALLEPAWRALPAIEELPVAECWTGFRPGSRDDAPILGPSGIEGLSIATGHHRNGILLAPITIDCMSRYIATGALDPAIAPFGLARFAPAPSPAAAEALRQAKAIPQATAVP